MCVQFICCKYNGIQYLAILQRRDLKKNSIGHCFINEQETNVLGKSHERKLGYSKSHNIIAQAHILLICSRNHNFQYLQSTADTIDVKKTF